MGPTNNHDESLERLRTKYRIKFEQDLPSGTLSKAHTRILEDIRRLGEIRYDGYAVDPAHTVSIAPWKLEAKTLAQKLVDSAHRSERRNEATWRHACDPLVFARANSDVACPNCRQRVWRSEIEAATNEESQDEASLRRRQEQRKPCSCPRVFRGLDPSEARGLSRIFTHREDETVVHVSPIKDEIRKAQRPDRVYGLRETHNFEYALNAPFSGPVGQVEPAGNARVVGDTVRVAPYSQQGDRLLFPFLFHEAKSEKAASDWYTIKLQTCFPIQAALETQRGLQVANGEMSRWKSGPLVWFLMSKGRDWRLCMAVVCEHTQTRSTVSNISYHIIDVWNGSITTKDGALQLLLIVDYIFDWARDTYRPTVLKETQLLGSGVNAVPSAFPDSDIFSTREPHLPDVTDGTTELQSKEIEGLLADYRSLGSADGAVRHAAFVESRFRCLFITKDNISTLMRLLEEQNTKKLAQHILNEFKDDKSVCISLDALSAIEKRWTGCERPGNLLRLARPAFHISMAITHYISSSWEQVRELSIIAVEADAFASLAKLPDKKSGKKRVREPSRSVVGEAGLIQAISQIQSQPQSELLMSSIRRHQLRLRPADTKTSDIPSYPTVQAKTGPHLNPGPGFRFVEELDTSHDLVQFMYFELKPGQFEPSESVFRISSCFHQAETAGTTSSMDACSKDQIDPSASAVLVYGGHQGVNTGPSTQSCICLFRLYKPGKPPSRSLLGKILKRTFEHKDVYHTIRGDKKPSFSTLGKGRTDMWNLQGTYGIYSRGPEFVNWITSLGCSPPTRQGSPRDNDVGSGRYLLLRDRYPLGSNSYFTTKNKQDKHQREYITRRLMEPEISYWRGRAEARKRAKLLCCECCASTDMQQGKWQARSRGASVNEEGKCAACMRVLYPLLSEEAHPAWFTGAMRFDPEGRRRNDGVPEEPYSDICELMAQTESFLRQKRNAGGARKRKSGEMD